MCGSPNTWEPLAAPVLAGDRYGGRPVYFSDVIVARDSRFQSFADLRGASWAFNEPDSHSGYLVTLVRLLELRETDQFFGKVVDAGWHQVSIDLVATGQLDASAVDSPVLAVELRNRPELQNRLRVIDRLGPSPIQPVVARRALDSGVDGIIVSNHGGRQVDGAVASLDALLEVRTALGPDTPVLMDGGIRGGADVLKGLALGANAVLVGRPYVYGLAVGGQAGVEAVLQQLAAETDLTLALIGGTVAHELDQSWIS